MREAFLPKNPRDIVEWRTQHPGSRLLLYRENLSGATLRSADLSNSLLSYTDFTNADLSFANFYNADLSNAILHNANLTGAILENANLSNAKLSGARMQRAFLKAADLTGTNLVDAHLFSANLSRTKLSGAVFQNACCTGCDLNQAQVSNANFFRADLSNAKLDRIKITQSDFSSASLRNASLAKASLEYTLLKEANLDGANCVSATFSNCVASKTSFKKTVFGKTTFQAVDLSEAIYLEDTVYRGPTYADVRTIVESGLLHDSFYQNCGFPDWFSKRLPEIFQTQNGPRYYTSFISCCEPDRDFAVLLCNRMRDENMKVWIARDDLKGGQKIKDQVDEAIQNHEKFLVVVSSNSMKSDWVKTELKKAIQVESQRACRVLFPLRIVPFDEIKLWNAFQCDLAIDMASELRDYYIPDFSDWRDPDFFENAFQKLCDDLKVP